MNGTLDLKFENGFFFVVTDWFLDRQGKWRDAEKLENRNKSITIKQLRWDGNRSYLVSQTIPLPKIPEFLKWDQVSDSVKIKKDIRVTLVSCTETQAWIQ